MLEVVRKWFRWCWCFYVHKMWISKHATQDLAFAKCSLKLLSLVDQFISFYIYFYYKRDRERRMNIKREIYFAEEN